MEEREQTEKNKGGQNQVSAAQKFADKSIIENLIDLAVYVSYDYVKIHVECGPTKGEVYAFFRKNHLNEEQRRSYGSLLKKEIEDKKYVKSQMACKDVGPAVAVADLIESRNYSEFLQKNNELASLDQFEQILIVRQGDVTYHFVPIEDNQKFLNDEQRALLNFTLFGSSYEGTKHSYEENLAMIEWIKINGARYRKTADDSTVSMLDGCGEIYRGCVIYKNLFENIKRKFLAEPDQTNETAEN